MKKLIICAFASAVVIAAAPVKADYNYGLARDGDMCWKDAAVRKGEFGFWQKCPAPANTAVAPKQARAHKRAHS
jgi:hypothetical protein